MAVDAYFISIEPNLQGKGLEAGLQFGSPHNPDPENFSERNIPHLTNRGNLAEVIVLDTLACNTDRHSGNLLLLFEDKTKKNKSCKFVMIDHTHIFGGPRWNEHTIKDLQNSDILYASEAVNLNHVPPKMGVFEPFLQQIEALTSETIETMIDSVPNEWGLSSAERKALLDFVVARKSKVRTTISQRIGS